ncbi:MULTISPECIES: NAD-dependent epimerase/dehydratase family protein [Enterobacter]|uniref:NAD-dependent epimerase/dehydratase family protein n=1 Tax=Enterobacter TaxID=547 RepID=UPI0028E588D2|nr:NAD-dependent epimerase/dehydratase family protein [Enterobacter cloacae]HDR2754058.1 NAD-dependent epimerase/dehydratase family protein [Enterobacter asburiae]WNT38402.1 NAD-dependent epimerase/dehydratase family protein [Enterobacter cloacae]HDR2791712.1 NAD-dependent epimerase/dehydratase family protein [Enterobacter asburiae]HDR2796653.1 NAD-dependent epimerase/dehydratase family protein [Enterobacter asburiae]HDR2797119.1 NAD-dependent epimerase/dehydratase family protein [Enterobacter
MQTILGASGQIARELARELKRDYTDDLRLVSRHPQKVNDSDETFAADLLDAQQTRNAVKGSDTVYFAAGLPPDSALWERQFPDMLKNALEATRMAGAKFVYFDNTYMYPQSNAPQTEETCFAPRGRKGKVRAEMADRVLDEMKRAEIPVLIGRAPEFYGPGKTQSFTNALILDKLKSGKQPRVPVRDDKLRTLIWTPDASRALAVLGNTPDAYGQSWHLPCCDDRLTYQQFVTLACDIFGQQADYSVISKLAFTVAGVVSKGAREIRELLPRYEFDNLFESAKFKQRFPDFAVTTYREGLEKIRQEWNKSGTL